MEDFTAKLKDQIVINSVVQKLNGKTFSEILGELKHTATIEEHKGLSELFSRHNLLDKKVNFKRRRGGWLINGVPSKISFIDERLVFHIKGKPYFRTSDPMDIQIDKTLKKKRNSSEYIFDLLLPKAHAAFPLIPVVASIVGSSLAHVFTGGFGSIPSDKELLDNEITKVVSNIKIQCSKMGDREVIRAKGNNQRASFTLAKKKSCKEVVPMFKERLMANLKKSFKSNQGPQKGVVERAVRGAAESTIR